VPEFIAFANNIDPDQPQHNAVSDQDRCWLLLTKSLSTIFQAANIIEPGQTQRYAAIDLAS